jgi:hypothetical protein
MSWTAKRARVASLSRSRTADDPDLVQARERLEYRTGQRLQLSIGAARVAFTGLLPSLLNDLDHA